MRRVVLGVVVLSVMGVALLSSSAAAGELELLLPLGRTAYQTNEWIDVSVVRSSDATLPAGTLELTLRAADAGGYSANWSVPAVPLQEGAALATEHLHVNAALLRPGVYDLQVACDGGTAGIPLEVYSHLRRSSYRLVNWGRATTPSAQLVQGEDSLGFNLFYGGYANDDEANFLRGGLDFMANCVMSGGHQMDLRSECDWSDPLVLRGGTRRVVRRAFIDRTRPNVPGVHFYDEPGLTWVKHPVTGEFGPHGVPSQTAAYRAAFGTDPLGHYEVDPANPQHVAQWRQWALWKLGFMDAAWQDAQFGVSEVRPDFLSLTQSQYGFSAFTDGYYFNVVRSLPITSGHGGYDDYGLGYFNPSYFLEVARARDYSKPCWYLPTWYGNTPADRFRLEQYLAFITNVQGLVSPPDSDPFEPESRPAAAGIVETNQLAARLGPVLTTLPVTRPPLAVLYSMSHNIHEQTLDRQANYAHANLHGQRLPLVYLACKLAHQPALVIVEEDILDGTLAAEHRVLLINSVAYLSPEVVAALEQFIAGGGTVLLTADCSVQIPGAETLPLTPDLPEAEQVRALYAQGKYQDADPFTTVGKYVQGAQPLAAALAERLAALGIAPPLECDQPGVVVARQAAGDVEYLFAVNATYDPQAGGRNALQPAAAVLGLRDDGRPVYDAAIGGPAGGFQPDGAGHLYYACRFGVGQLRAFARTTRPIAAVRVAQPVLARDYTQSDSPLVLRAAAAVVDADGGLLSGSFPLRVRLLDPAGQVRYDLYRATTHGVLELELPLALTDAPGAWTLEVQELLALTSGSAAVQLGAAPTCNAAAGATHRAVAWHGEKPHVYRFFRTHQDVTLVLGDAPYVAAAAERLQAALARWDVRCTLVSAAEVNRPRELTAEEAATWVGLEYAPTGQLQPGRENSVTQVGFDVRGPVVLLGNADNNPLLKFVHEQRFLPYAPVPGKFPGRGRGYVAWQRDAIGPLQESLALWADDEAGLHEAVGSLFEMLSGLDPLLPLRLPTSSQVFAAQPQASMAGLTLRWSARQPDRALALASLGGHVLALSADGTQSVFLTDGTLGSEEVLPWSDLPARAASLAAPPDDAARQRAKALAPPTRLVKFALATGERLVVVYWGGDVDVFAGDARLAHDRLPTDAAAAALHDGQLVVSLADGRVQAYALP